MIQVLALCGGVGGAKLALGLHHVLPPGDLMVMVNTGDDFEHLGLSLSPDVDTVMYTLGGVSNPELGWGRAGDTWNFMAEIERLGGETWFRLGDKDLAVHIERTRRLQAGESLSGITVDMSRHFGIVRINGNIRSCSMHNRCIIWNRILHFHFVCPPIRKSGSI